MTVVGKVYGHVPVLIEQNFINLSVDTIHVALFDNAHVFNVTDEFWVDILANEIAGAGYSEGGIEIIHAGARLDFDAATGIYSFGKTANDSVWAASTLTANFAVVYNYIDHGGVPHDSSELLCCLDFGRTKVTSNTPFEIRWHANGIFRFRPNP